MRYRELDIHTRREAPAHAKTGAAALLIRAGYLRTEGEPTLLGRRATSHLIEVAKSTPDLFTKIGLRVLRTSEPEVIFELASGASKVLRCQACGYAAPLETARFRKRPGRAGPMLPIQSIATPNCSTIESLAAFLRITKENTAKALMYTRASDGQFVLVVLRGDTQISERKLQEQVGELRPATAEQVSAAGAVAGYASPIGLKDVFVVVDDLVPQSVNLVAGANMPGYHLLNTNYERDYQAQLIADLALAAEGHPCPNCGMPLTLSSGILVADDRGYRFENLLLALAEANHDERGLCLPSWAAPFEIYLIYLPSRAIDTLGKAEELYQGLIAADMSVLFDDRDERAGVKFNDADLIGCPIRLTVGERNLKNGMVELKFRNQEGIQLLSQDDATGVIRSLSDVRP